MKRRSLRRRIAGAFTGLAVLAGLSGGLLCVLFAYTVEDHIFNRLVALEIANLEAAPEGETVLPEPRLPFAAYYPEVELPVVLRGPLEAEPERREIFGDDGRHYHLRRFRAAPGQSAVWVVLQVEDFLVVRPAITEITAFLGWVILLISVGAGVAGLYLAHRVTKPLRSLAAEVAALEPGDLPERWRGDYPPDEVGSLSNALQAAFARIRRFIDREQRFTQDASHELRTPLTVIESSATLLAKEGPVAGPEGPQHDVLIGRIQSAALAMHQSVDALLALAREEEPVRRERATAVLSVVERTVVNHAALLEGKAVAVRVEIEPQWRVAGDPAALQVLVSNLVSNAFRYTREGEVRITQDGDTLLVSDSGIGIDEAIRQDITRPAVKGRDSPGLGLGLSIVERLCKRYGWSFELESGADGTTARLGLKATGFERETDRSGRDGIRVYPVGSGTAGQA